jgi:hypothetical protein
MKLLTAVSRQCQEFPANGSAALADVKPEQCGFLMVVEPPDGVLEPLFRIDPRFWHQGVVDTAFPVLLPERLENQLLDISRALEPF